jgi:hypothetical protein
MWSMMRRLVVLLLATVVGIVVGVVGVDMADVRQGIPGAHADSSPGAGWVLAGYQNYYYTYYVTEQVGTTTVSQYLYHEPYRDEVIYFSGTALVSITWGFRLANSYTKLLTYRSSCWLNPYYPWDTQCSWVSEYRTDQYWEAYQQYNYATVNEPYVLTYYRPVYGSVQVPVYQRVQRTGVCSVPIYQFVGGDGAVTFNGDGTFTMWIPQSSCVYSPFINYYQQATVQTVYTGQSCRQQLNARLEMSTASRTYYVSTTITYGVQSGQRYQCQTIYWPTWVYWGSRDCSYSAGWCPSQGYWEYSTYYSADGLWRYDRSAYHHPCPSCWVSCTDQIYYKTNQPVTDCRYMPYDWIQEYRSGGYYTDTFFNYYERRWYTTQCWNTYALAATSITQSEWVDRYVPSTSWQQMTLRLPAMPDVQIGVNPGAAGLTGLASWFWVENNGISESQGPNGIRVRVIPARYDWDFNGDDVTDLSTTSPGQPYPIPSDVRYTYQRSSASQPGHAYRVRLTAVYDLQVDVGQGYQTVGQIAQERIRLYPVQQLQSSLGG